MTKSLGCLIISINNINDKYFSKFGIFIVAFIFHLLFIFQGMDVTDTGYHLTNQVSAFSFPVEFSPFNSFMLLTDLVGGFWLFLIGEPNLLWARLGGVLIIALNAAIIFSILSAHFERKRAFLVVFISMLILTMRPGLYIIDYFIFPALLINIEFWILNKILMERGKNDFHNFLLGFMVVPIILSRIPLITIILIPAIIFIYSLIKQVDFLKYKKGAITSFLGFLSAIAIFGIIYWTTGILNSYFDNIYSMIVASTSGNTGYVDQTHTMSFLLRSYLFDYRNIALGTIVLCILFYTLSLLKRRIGSIYVWIVTLSLTFGIILFMIYRNIYIDFLAYCFLEVMIGIIILIASIIVIAENDDRRNKIIKFLLFSGVIVMIITPLGSNGGAIKSFYGMWLILPLAILCGYQLRTSTKNKTIGSIFSLMNCALLSLLILALFFHGTNIYRDDINRINLGTEFSSSSLKGIYSTPERVRAVDDLIIKIREFSNKSDRLLMFNSIPMFFYLTETRPALGNPWSDADPLKKIKSSMDELKNDGRYPKLFIYSKVNTRDRNWPNGNIPIAEENLEKFMYIKIELINKSKYFLLWENEVFAIYQRPKFYRSHDETILSRT